ncbi:hypothetical protein ACFE04_020367 [Oxalis oulophora]
MDTEIPMEKWGTWEELLLGGAILRHGTVDWTLVATELTQRLYPSNFTPQVCKAKYEDLIKRYSGCTAWFEELKKQRIAELRRALEQSDDSIGLKADKEEHNHVDNETSQIESVPRQKYEGVDSSSKEASKDGLSAGSFTQETLTNWSPDCQNAATVPNEDMENKPGISEFSKQERGLTMENLWQRMFVGKGLRKRRGKRKRKDCSSKDIKEVSSIGESDIMISPRSVVNASWCKENSTCDDSDQIAKSSGGDDQSRCSSKETVHDLTVMGIFGTVFHNDCASVFRRRLDSQKRGRYKKMILRHMDFDTLRSRVTSGSITSSAELFRDMLLISNNALVFYSKSTREYKSALLLRGIVTKALRQQLKDYCTKAKTTNLLPSHNRSINVHLSNEKPSGKVDNAKNSVARASNGRGKWPSNSEAPLLALAKTKKSLGRPKKVGQQQPGSTMAKGRKRSRARLGHKTSGGHIISNMRSWDVTLETPPQRGLAISDNIVSWAGRQLPSKPAAIGRGPDISLWHSLSAWCPSTIDIARSFGDPRKVYLLAFDKV